MTSRTKIIEETKNEEKQSIWVFRCLF